jgi:hypothetical protein
VSGDCNVCINGELPSYSPTCVECGLSRKNYKPITKADRIRSMTDEELAEWLCDIAGWLPMYEGKMHPILDWLRQEACE